MLAAALAAQPGCYGARMTGAGFGGSVVALIDTARIEPALAASTAAYARCFGNTPRAFVARVARRRKIARWLNVGTIH